MKGVSRLLQPMKDKLALMVSRVVIRLVDDTGAFQRVQVDGLEGETLDKLEVITSWGFASNPPDGSEGVMVAAGGVRSHGLIISIGNREFRLKGLKKGEAALHDDQGQVVWLKRDGLVLESPFKVDVQAPEVNITANSATVDADDTTVTGNATVEGDATVKGNVKLGDGASKFVMLADMTPSTKVQAK